MILAVTGGKGGVGKSTVALNLAAELDGVVVDADLGMADLPSARGPDLHDVLTGRAGPLEAVRDLGSVRVVPCGRTLAGARAADARALADAVGPLDREVGPVVLDCPAGLRSDAGVPVAVADACVLVTRPDPAALSDAVRARELARELDTPLARVVLNRAERPTTRVADLLGAPVATLPESPALARAQRSGVPVGAVAPGAPVTRRIESLAERLQSVLSSR
jgi:septum site-determining protein MinD